MGSEDTGPALTDFVPSSGLPPTWTDFSKVIITMPKVHVSGGHFDNTTLECRGIRESTYRHCHSVTMTDWAF